MYVFKYLNGVKNNVGNSGNCPTCFSRMNTHRLGQIPECELNFSFVVSKGMGIRASDYERAGIE